jgi:hypothetical protein
VTDPDHKALAAPKLNIVVAHPCAWLSRCLGIIAASERFKPNEMAVNGRRASSISDRSVDGA